MENLFLRLFGNSFFKVTLRFSQHPDAESVLAMMHRLEKAGKKPKFKLQPVANGEQLVVYTSANDHRPGEWGNSPAENLKGLKKALERLADAPYIDTADIA